MSCSPFRVPVARLETGRAATQLTAVPEHQSSPTQAERGANMADTGRLPAPVMEHWDWQLRAACRGMDSSTFFHPTDERGPAKTNRITAAKAVCAGCPARLDCLNHALETREPYGIWGGLSEDERAKLLGLSSLRYPAAQPSIMRTPERDHPSPLLVAH
jgi:WhiB family redox-sensing transcriptional regulator